MLSNPHLKNASCSITETDSGISNSFMLMQHSNALFLIDVNDSGIVISDNFKQKRKANFPI